MESIKTRIEQEVKNTNTISGYDITRDDLPEHVLLALKILKNEASQEEVVFYCLSCMLAYNNVHDLYSDDELKEFSSQILKSIE